MDNSTKHKLIIRFECPSCKQINEAQLKDVLSIDVGTQYIGSGDYAGEVQGVQFNCTGCREWFEVEN